MYVYVYMHVYLTSIMSYTIYNYIYIYKYYVYIYIYVYILIIHIYIYIYANMLKLQILPYILPERKQGGPCLVFRSPALLHVLIIHLLFQPCTVLNEA